MNGSLNIESYVRLTLDDGTVKDDREVSWKSISEMKTVSYFGKKKTVYVCALPVAFVDVFHDRLEVHMQIPDGCSEYQAIRSKADFNAGQTRDAVVGRCVGLVKNSVVIEERFLNGVNNEVVGVRI